MISGWPAGAVPCLDTITSLLAFDVGEPAIASACNSVMELFIAYSFGARTSPVTNTRRLLYWSISTRTCGLRKYPFASSFVSSICSAVRLLPATRRRPR
jgi:hypothetical protein